MQPTATRRPAWLYGFLTAALLAALFLSLAAFGDWQNAHGWRVLTQLDGSVDALRAWSSELYEWLIAHPAEVGRFVADSAAVAALIALMSAPIYVQRVRDHIQALRLRPHGRAPRLTRRRAQ